MTLYLDDNYDYSNGTFTGMSDETKKQFQNDLNILYTAFTGNKDMPSDITKFSDIKLRDYHNMEQCKGEHPKFETTIRGPLSNNLIQKYAENLKKIWG